MIYKFITNSAEVARYAIDSGVQRIFVDGEQLGKADRQGHLDTHKAIHKPEDAHAIKTQVPEAEVMYRCNPVHNEFEAELASVLAGPVDRIMLPMFTTAGEVHRCAQLAAGRTKVTLLLETPQALTRIDDILKVCHDYESIDEIHIGLNDLHLAMGLNFMFELLTGGIVEYAIKRIRNEPAIRYGFGGVAQVGEGAVPAEVILGEHVRLGSEMVILSRTFHHRANSIKELQSRIDLPDALEKLNQQVSFWKQVNADKIEENRKRLHQLVSKVVLQNVNT